MHLRCDLSQSETSGGHICLHNMPCFFGWIIPQSLTDIWLSPFFLYICLGSLCISWTSNTRMILDVWSGRVKNQVSVCTWMICHLCNKTSRTEFMHIYATKMQYGCSNMGYHSTRERLCILPDQIIENDEPQHDFVLLGWGSKCTTSKRARCLKIVPFLHHF